MTRARHTLIVTDIFGATDAVKNLSRRLKLQGNTVSIIDPYQGKKHPKGQEADIYEHFLNECGHEQYLTHVKRRLTAVLTPTNQDVFMIGFSAGASAAWRALDRTRALFKTDENSQLIKHFTGFYPTQIRHYLGLSSICKSSFIFPKHENHFDVKDAIGHLSSGHHTRCLQTPFDHGFMNPDSKNYQHNARIEFEKILLENNTETTNKSAWQFLKNAKRLND